MSKNMNMTQGRPLRLLLTFALPLMLGNVCQQLYTVVDTAVVGRGVGIEALASLGSVDQINWLTVNIVTSLTAGAGVRISQKFGEGDMQGMKRVLGQGAVLSLAITIVGMVLVLAGLPLFLTVMRVPQELRALCSLYVQILTCGMLSMVLYNYTSTALRSVGDSKTPLLAMIVSSVTNIVLDCLAVFVLDWGIAGAAAATVIAQLVSGVICAVRMYRMPILRFSGEDLRPEWPMIADLLHLGLPIAFKAVVLTVSSMFRQTLINGFGTSFIAGFTAANKLYGVLQICAMAYGSAVTTYVGQNYGAGKMERIKSGMRSALIMAVVTAVVIAIPMFVFGRPLTALFISADDAALAAAAGVIAYDYLRVMAVGLFTLYLLYVYLMALQGLGKSVVTMISGFVECALCLSVGIVTAFTSASRLLYFSDMIGWLGAVIFLAWHYRRQMVQLEREHTTAQYSKETSMQN